ncbi:uncharacterized protein [Typha latifolia]|uniref:uncharacterized protein n=1 Tax=Typha latifolia TaxID=4733 RepID=UPI003C2DF693
MSNHAIGLESRKRKEREAGSKPPPPTLALKPEQSRLAASGGNRLLAGYLAHEFLTRGTLLGRPAGPAPAKKSDTGQVRSGSDPPKAPLAYPDVARLLKWDGAHIPGVVNPTELARWLPR